MSGLLDPTATLRPTTDVARAIFADPTSRAFEERLALLAPTDATVLIVGETGTGKEVAARELHALSGRTGPFLAINCAAMTETLAEAELFGHEKGAFTGAMRSQPGWFEAASGGTLLLDEVGELPLSLQTKLLRVLQEREVTRVGSRTARPIDARIIAATNVDLQNAVIKGAFRRDLLFRLAVATLHLRPLRDRREDIEKLARHFLKLYGQKYGREQVFANDALAALARYDWPGNVRELDNVMHRAVLQNAGGAIGAADLSFTPFGDAPAPPPAAPSGLEDTIRRLAAQWCADHEPNMLQRATRALVQAGFDAAGGNQVRAAELLGVSRNTLRTQLAHLGAIAPRQRPADAELPEIDKRVWARVRIGVQKFGTSALLRFDTALQRRLAAQRIHVDWRDFPTGPALVEALQNGEIDIGSTGEMSPLMARADRPALVYLAYEQAQPASVGLVVRAEAPITGVTGLRGKRVALSQGANGHLLLVRALEAHDMDIDDIEPVYMPPRLYPAPDTIAAVDAWAMWDPFLSEWQGRGKVRTLLDGTGLLQNRRFYLARRDYAESAPHVIDEILASVFRVGRQAADAPAPAANLLSGVFDMQAEWLETAMRRLGPGAERLNSTVLKEQQRIADQSFALGLLPQAVSITDVVWKSDFPEIV